MKQILTLDEYKARIIEVVTEFFRSRGLDERLDGVYREIVLETIMERSINENLMLRDEYRELFIAIFETDENGDDWSEDYADDEIQELIDRKEFKESYGNYDIDDFKEYLFADLDVSEKYRDILRHLYLDTIERMSYEIEQEIFKILWE